jgi:hypothetical protein
MKLNLTLSLFFVLMIFSGRSVAQTMPLSLNFNSHNEISDGIQYSNSSVWLQYRGIVLALADTFSHHGAKWNLQAESDFIRADIANESGYTNPNDLLDSLDNTGTVEVDPHNHFDNNSSSMTYNPYNYSDLAHLLDSAGLASPRNNMGGFLYTTATDFMPYQNPVAGNMYPNYSWNPNVIWGAGSPNHINDYNGYGVWKPQGGGVNFMNHDPSKHLTFIGNGCSFVVFDTTHVSTIVNGIVLMLQYIQYQPYDPMAMYTASIQMNFRDIATPGYIDTIAAIVRGIEQYRNSGQIVYQTLTEKYTTWYTAHSSSSDHFKLDCPVLTLGVEEERTGAAQLWPNPSNGILNVSSPGQPAEAVEVLDLQGKCLLRKELSQETAYQLDLSSLSPGLYFLRQVSTGGESRIDKFMKE